MKDSEPAVVLIQHWKQNESVMPLRISNILVFLVIAVVFSSGQDYGNADYPEYES